MSHETSSQIVLQTHNLNLPPQEALTNTLDDLRNFLYEVRDPRDPDEPIFDGGFQITPTRAIMAGLRKHKASVYLGFAEELPQDPNQPLFSSGEQSWSRGIVGGVKSLIEDDRNTGIVQLGGGVLMPEQQTSLKGLERLQRLVPEGKMHAVVYGGLRKTGMESNFEGHKFESVSLQLEPEQLQDRWGWDLSDKERYKEIGERLARQHIDGVTIDPVHMWREHGKIQGLHMDWDEALYAIEETGVPVKDLHVPIARVDRHPDDRKRSLEEAKMLISNPQQFIWTQTGEILAAGVEIWYGQNRDNPDAKLRAVLEMPYAGLAQLGLTGSKSDVYMANRHVVHNLRGFLESKLADAQRRNPRPMPTGSTPNS
ncbi:MAG TPA: hypothetical protein VLG16_03865 [Candidatus Saccharimonadales bacterium]|nr:hypothetical protein [Candidatus Saccharimonadales bacterium]